MGWVAVPVRESISSLEVELGRRQRRWGRETPAHWWIIGVCGTALLFGCAKTDAGANVQTDGTTSGLAGGGGSSPSGGTTPGWAGVYRSAQSGGATPGLAGSGGLSPSGGTTAGLAGGDGSSQSCDAAIGWGGGDGSSGCDPDCEQLECGLDPVCGLECGPCTDGNVCNEGVCSEPIPYGESGQSCAGLTGDECHGESCCTTLVLPAGSYLMGRGSEPCSVDCWPEDQPEHPRGVSRFALDKYEVTVGRFRAFLEAGQGTQANPPTAGSGAHPLIDGSGWNSWWKEQLPTRQEALAAMVKCGADRQTWTDEPGSNETYPMTCLSWYVAFAFCAWDGGRLPTEAEWEYAAAGGDENRLYPWGGGPTGAAGAGGVAGAPSVSLPANYQDNHSTPFLAVGTEPGGDGRWGHSDLGGSMSEWVLDAWGPYPDTQTECIDFAPLSESYHRVVRGGWWFHAAYRLRATRREPAPAEYADYAHGVRCARSAP